MQPDTTFLSKVGEMIKINKEFEAQQGYNRLITWSRLPATITKRRGLRKYTYVLSYGNTDDRVYLSYAVEKPDWKKPNQALMHYEETTLRECMFKAWRKISETGIKVRGNHERSRVF